jgi:tetratricopeptide (TPR) repeat protein
MPRAFILNLLLGSMLLLMLGCAPKQNASLTMESLLAGAPEEAVDLTAQEHKQKGDLLLSQGKKELAFVHYNKALQKDPDNPALRVRKGRILLDQKLYGQALEEYAAVLQVNPKDKEALYGAGRASFGKRQYTEAGSYLERALQEEPELWQAHNLLGLCLCAEGKYADANRSL